MDILDTASLPMFSPYDEEEGGSTDIDEEEDIEIQFKEPCAEGTKSPDPSPSRSTRGKKINYLEMHTGKLSPQSMIRTGEKVNDGKEKSSPTKTDAMSKKGKAVRKICLDGQDEDATDAVHRRLNGRKVPKSDA